MNVDFVKLTLEEGRECRTLKLNEKHYGIVVQRNELYFTAESFSTPLQAANAARRLKKCKDLNCKPTNKKAVTKNTDKVEKVEPKKPKKAQQIEPVKLYSETEMAALTHLRFREAWVILDIRGMFVKETLTKSRVVEYTKDKNKAKIFKTYEDARMMSKTLDSVAKVGHSLKRFFIENPDSKADRVKKDKEKKKAADELSEFLTDTGDNYKLELNGTSFESTWW